MTAASGAPAQAFEGGPPEPAGRPLEPAGNGRPRWMAATLHASGTESGVQVDSSVALLLAVPPLAADLPVSPVFVGRRRRWWLRV